MSHLQRVRLLQCVPLTTSSVTTACPAYNKFGYYSVSHLQRVRLQQRVPLTTSSVTTACHAYNEFGYYSVSCLQRVRLLQCVMLTMSSVTTMCHAYNEFRLLQCVMLTMSSVTTVCHAYNEFGYYSVSRLKPVRLLFWVPLTTSFGKNFGQINMLAPPHWGLACPHLENPVSATA